MNKTAMTILISSGILAGQLAMADVPLYDGAVAKVESASLVQRMGNVNEKAHFDLVATVRVVTGCMPTQELVRQMSYQSSNLLEITLLAASNADRSTFPHCFAIGSAEEKVTLGSYAPDAVPAQIFVNGIPATRQ